MYFWSYVDEPEENPLRPSPPNKNPEYALDDRPANKGKGKAV